MGPHQAQDHVPGAVRQRQNSSATARRALTRDLHIARARLQWRKAEIGIGKAGVEAREKEGAYTVTLDEADIERPTC